MDKSIQQELDELALAISAQLWSKIRSWSGADVLIRRKQTNSQGGVIPFTVVTKYSGELSWLFTRLRDIGAQHEGFYLVKYRFFTDLAIAAESVSSDEPIDILLLTTLREAYQFFAENAVQLAANEWSPVFGGNAIIQSDSNRLQKISLIKFFRARGIAV